MFALQKSRFEQVAEEYTFVTRSSILEEQEQFQRSLENLRQESTTQSHFQIQRLWQSLEDEMSGYVQQRLSLQRQNLVDDENVQQSMLVSEARQEFAVCQSVNKNLQDECSQIMNRLFNAGTLIHRRVISDQHHQTIISIDAR